MKIWRSIKKSIIRIFKELLHESFHHGLLTGLIAAGWDPKKAAEYVCEIYEAERKYKKDLLQRKWIDETLEKYE